MPVLYLAAYAGDRRMIDAITPQNRPSPSSGYLFLRDLRILAADRKSGVEGKSVDLGGRRTIKKKLTLSHI